VAEVAIASQFGRAGAAPDLLLVSVAAVAAAGGPDTGAAYGFAAGMAADLLVATPAGLLALAFTVVGWAVGRATAPPAARCALLAGLGSGVLVMAAATTIGGAPSPPPAALLRLAFGSGTGALVAPPIFAAVRRLIGRL
jgi:rod shape-determining protein MreD